MTLVYLLYSIGFGLFLLALLPVVLLQAVRYGKYRRGTLERVGRYPVSLTRSCATRRPVWIHAVSVGEVGAARPLITLFREKHPDVPLLVSTVTETGGGVGGAQIRGAPVG